MLVSVSLRSRPDKIRVTKWFNMYYQAEEFKPGKINHLLVVEHKSGDFKGFSIVIASGGNDAVGEDAVINFANKLPDTVDASFLRSHAKKLGLVVVE